LKSFLKYLLALFFIVAGAGHFLKPETYLKIMPTYVPYPYAMVLISGAAESLLGLLILFRRTRKAAAWGLIALLIAIFPANLNMALYPDQFSEIPRWVLYARLPLQGVLIAWVYGFTKNASS
jgi:uncharacterized membrane protein